MLTQDHLIYSDSDRQKQALCRHACASARDYQVPFSAAFETAAAAPARIDTGSMLVDALLMADIVLNFLTAYERQVGGNVHVRMGN